ncbi:MAG: hypothetical protein IJU74_07830 [Bacteroidales bacterium]|nr:hypothetical protein [Bacteroidales bacterium]
MKKIADSILDGRVHFIGQFSQFRVGFTGHRATINATYFLLAGNGRADNCQGGNAVRPHFASA